MKFTLDETASRYLIHSYEDGLVRINNQSWQSSLIVSPQTLINNWRPSSIEQLQDDDFAAVIELQPEFLILGTGKTQAFPPIRCYSSLIQAGIHVEFMNTGAACRTFNIMLSEDRPVAAALII
ncbi:MAG: Mth938-like domain-containing protein [gamma proteobacterium symbiont of Bathyaustriella thionipta]|nr:Mth938-like domain-containing protein [gamma proteobacterium symbiont of Bathyaustriella thionipta]